MIQKIKKFIAVAAVSLLMVTPGLVPAFAGVASAGIGGNLCSGANAASGQGGPDSASGTSCGSAGTNSDNSGIKELAAKIVQAFSIIVGAVSVIMIIYGGFRYITSGGDSGRVGNAKNTLIYAIVGLIIVALAQVIVHFVINTAGSSASSF
ncbi:MAG: pilin [Patescibacteria group bacterium]|mgnify:CR=1 FL=1